MINQIEEDRGFIPDDLPRGVSPELAAANPDVQAIIQPRLTMLMEIADSFLLTIIEAMETVPYGIRWICKQIRSLTRVSWFSSFYVLLQVLGWDQFGLEDHSPAGKQKLTFTDCSRCLVIVTLTFSENTRKRPILPCVP